MRCAQHSLKADPHLGNNGPILLQTGGMLLTMASSRRRAKALRCRSPKQTPPPWQTLPRQQNKRKTSSSHLSLRHPPRHTPLPVLQVAGMLTMLGRWASSGIQAVVCVSG